MTDLVTSVSLTELDSNRELVKSILVESKPNLDVSPGSALDGLLVEPEALLAAGHQARLVSLSNSMSLQAISDNIVTVTDEEVDRLVSNYFIVRRDATAASGPVRIIVSAAIPYQIPAGFAFTYNNQAFATTVDYRIYAPDSVGVQESANVRRLILRSDNRYEFTISVTAQKTGSDGRLLADTVLTITDPLTGMEEAIVAADFEGGDTRETNEELLARAAAGITAKVLAGPEHIQASLADAFPGTTAAVIGVGSPLMVRDAGNLFGISQGGKQDIYVRTTEFPRTKTLRMTGTVVEASAQRVLLSIPRADSSGVYRVTAIRAAGLSALGGNQPESVTIGVSTEPLYQPTFVTAQDAAYSAYATLNVLFIDTTGEAPYTLNEQREYDVDLVYMPSIDAVNAYVTDSTRRPAGQDLLVRAGVPCQISVQATIRIPSSVVPPTIADLRSAIVAAVNETPFGTSSLSSFVIHRAIADLVPRGDVVNTVLRGTILAPDQTDHAIETGPELTLVESPENGIGAANTYFCCDPASVELTIVSR
jgi:uncharacterized phage protein gp47/JayE